jgi:hypothetical protein
VLAEFLASIKTIPGFDCLELKRLGQERLQAELAGLTPRQTPAG